MRVNVKNEKFYWDKLDLFCYKRIRSAGIVALVILSWWGVFLLLSHTIGSI